MKDSLEICRMLESCPTTENCLCLLYSGHIIAIMIWRKVLVKKYQPILFLLLGYFPGLPFFTICGNLERKVEKKNNGRNWPCIVDNKCFQQGSKCGQPVQSSLSTETMQQLWKKKKYRAHLWNIDGTTH